MPNAYAKTGQQLTVPQYFYRPERSSMWYVRVIAPKHVQHLVADKEFRKSTGHAEILRAKPVGMALIAEKFREWDSLARTVADAGIACVPTVLTGGLIERICAARLYSWMRSDDDERFEGDGLTDEELVEIEDFCKLTDAAMRSVLAQGSASPRWCAVLESTTDWCRTMGYEVEATDPMYTKLARDFAKVEREAQRRITLRNGGEDAETPREPSSVGQPLSAVTEAFRDYKSPKAASKYLSTLLNAWRLFIAHCGDIALDSVTPAHVFEFMSARMHAEDKPWSEARAKGLGARTLREVFGLARTMGLMTIDNPFDGLEAFPSLSKEEEASRKQPRYPFSSVHLNKLFGSEWYDPTNNNVFRGKMRADLGARYWVPLIGLFHGNRVREASQLVASDFSLDGDLLVISFRKELDDDAEDTPRAESSKTSRTMSANDAVLQKMRSVKNPATCRAIPAHPGLVKLGLVEFVEKRREASGPNALLFPSSFPNSGGKSPKLGRSYEQAFLRFVRDRLNFGNGHGNHSFRHQLEDRVRIAQARRGIWPAGLGQKYTGRTRTRDVDRGVLRAEGSEAVYGAGYPPADMLQFIETLDFSDVALPPAYAVWLAQGNKHKG